MESALSPRSAAIRSFDRSPWKGIFAAQPFKRANSSSAPATLIRDHRIPKLPQIFWRGNCIGCNTEICDLPSVQALPVLLPGQRANGRASVTSTRSHVLLNVSKACVIGVQKDASGRQPAFLRDGSAQRPATLVLGSWAAVEPARRATAR